MKNVILKDNNRMLLKKEGADQIVKSGTVMVTLQPYRKGIPLRRMYLGMASAGERIPSPDVPVPSDSFSDISCILILEAIHGDAVLGSCDEEHDTPIFKLSEEAGFFNSPDEKIAFWGVISERYIQNNRDKLVASDKRKAERRRSKSRVTRIMAESFANSVSRDKIRIEKKDGGIYDAAAFLCRHRGIYIKPYDELKKISEDPDNLKLSDIARLSGFPVREAVLGNKWYKRTETGFIGFISEDDRRKEVVVFYRSGKLFIFDPATGEVRPFLKDDRNRIENKVLYFDRPFGKKPVKFKDVVIFASKEINLSDIIILLLSMLLLSLVGVALSALNQSIYDDVIPKQKEELAYVIGSIFLATLVANFLFAIAKNLTDYRISTKVGNSVQLAIFHRIFHLPEQFFRGKESAEQAYRIEQLSNTYISVLKNSLDITIGILFSVVYLHRMYRCSAALAHIGLLIALVGMVITFVTGTTQRKISRIKMRQTAGIRSFLYQAFTGIGTIRMAGAEDAVLERYMEKEGSLQELQGKLDLIQRRSSLFVSILNGTSMLLMYWIMGSGRAGDVSLGVFMGFITANTMFSGQILQAAGSLCGVITMLPIIKDTGELLMTIPECGGDGRILSNLRGDIKLSGVWYGYKGSDKMILKDISLHIHPGEYVGIVGPSGCGKSTMLRLLLGFAAPDRGQIYYDNVSISKINTVELRRKIGTVLQDGSLVSGSILQNIRIVNPHADIKAVEEAIETAGLKDEISAMPMGLMTYVSENALTISGGQKQRILIARAILGAPEILIFDEATSSLDNIAQENISNALSRFNATRIVVAHRLSTVKLCDRILVFNDGRIVEEGTYEELMERKGNFYEMVKIQQAV